MRDAFPFPCRAKNFLQRRMLRLPSQFFHDSVRAGIEHAWIAWPPAYDSERDPSSGYSLRLSVNLTNGIAGSLADVVAAHPRIAHLLQREDVGAGDIHNMHKIPTARAIGGSVVVAINLKAIALSGGNLEQDWNEVSFGVVSFSQFRSRAGSAEIAEGKHAPSIRARVPPQDLLEDQLGFPVRIGWPRGG